MKSWVLALAAIGLLSLALAACGGTGKAAHSSSQASSSADAATTTAGSTVSAAQTRPAPVLTKTDADADNDSGSVGEGADNDKVLHFGHEASAGDKRAIDALIKRYYAAAVAEDGAKACSMIYSTLAEAVPEDFGQTPPGPGYMNGRTCPAVVTLLFKHFHPQIALELPKLEVAHVRLVEHHGVAVLSFGSLPERTIFVAREGQTWKVQQLLDSELP